MHIIFLIGDHALLRKMISQKNSTQTRQWSYVLRVYAPKFMAEYPVVSRKESIKPLKIRPPAIKHIDIFLRRSA